MTYHGTGTPISEPQGSNDARGQVAARPRLLDDVRSRLRLKHYSLKMEQAYVYWIRRYIHANGWHHHRELHGASVDRLLSLLATRDRAAASTQDQDKPPTQLSPSLAPTTATQTQLIDAT